MKNLTKQLGIITFSLIILFVMATCIEDDGKDEGSDGALGDTLNLSGIVYTEEPDPEDLFGFKVIYQQYSGSKLNVSEHKSGKGGTISATTGLFLFTIDTPADDILEDASGVEEELKKMFNNVQTTAALETKTFTIASFDVDDQLEAELSRVYNSRKLDLTTAKMTMNSISAIYIYTTHDITVKAKGKEIEGEAIVGFPVKIKSNDIDFTLKKGWNILKNSISGTITLDDISDLNSASGSLTMSMTTADSSNLKWVLE